MAPESEPQSRVPWAPVNEATEPATPPAPAEELTPTKPMLPAWIQREDVPVPVEGEDGEILAPVAAPLADELLPRPGTTPDTAAGPVSPYDASSGGLWNVDPVHLLGESAVASAALSAAGAPTPLGGVPTVAAQVGVQPPDFGDGGPAFAPTFDEEPEPAPMTNKERADVLAEGIVAEETARLAVSGSALEAGTAYAPRAFDTEDMAADAEAGWAPEADPATPEAEDYAEPLMPSPDGPTPPSGGDDPTSKRRLWWLWLLIALVVIGGAVAAWMATHQPEATVVPGVVVTIAPPTPTITPTPAPTGTAFQASMPTTVGTYSLVGATVLEPADVALTSGRVADGVDLTYRSGGDTMTVRALQYYNEDDAKAMFTEFAGDPAATEPVMAGGTQVGESAAITSPAPGVVWRNGTSVFILVGPADQVAGFYALFGL